jgi:hypothetical protein
MNKRQKEIKIEYTKRRKYGKSSKEERNGEYTERKKRR